jgi:hypothetical protein
LRVTRERGGQENTLAARVSKVNYAGATTSLKLDAAGLGLEALVIDPEGLAGGDSCFVELPPDRITALEK